MKLSAQDKIILSALLPTAASHERLQHVLAEQLLPDLWQSVVTKSSALGTASLLRFNLLSFGLLKSLPETSRVQLASIAQLQAARHLAYTSETLRLISALAEKNITAIPLKGAALMLGEYYPQSGMRAAVDIDLLIAPNQTAEASRIAMACGYTERIYVASVRPQHRLANEMNHIPPHRGPGGMLLELHHRAFRYAYGNRDFGFAEIAPRAELHTARAGEETRAFLLPAPEDLGIHLIHHTLVDLSGTKSFLRTLADLYFIQQRHADLFSGTEQRAAELGFAGAVRKTKDILQLIANGSWNDFERLTDSDETALLLEAALLKEAEDLSEAARLIEYFDLRRHPLGKIRSLFAMVFTTRKHLAELYQQPDERRVYLNYWRRPFDLLKKIRWSGLRPTNLRRVLKLRKIGEF